jgi:putative DNA primase/helicase
VKGYDFNDLAQGQGPEAVRALLAAAAPPPEDPTEAPTRAEPPAESPPPAEPSAPAAAKAPPEDEAARTVATLARLDPIAYGQARKAAADALGCRASDLDAAVKAARKDTAADNLPGQPLHFDEPEPWPRPVKGADLLDVIEATIKRFCILDPPSYTAAALWIVFTHAVDLAHTAPILYLTSPEPRCGKSTLLHLLGLLVSKPLPAANVTPSALFRTIEAASPTILLDEADAGLNDNEDMRGLLNSGHTRVSAFVIRIEGEQREPRKFSTWGCRAIAGIGKGAQTIMDRSVTILLRRKLPTETVEKLRHAPPGTFDTLKRKAARFVADHADRLKTARPELPESLNDRAQDNWEPLLAIADAAGGQWPEKARAAALALAGSVEETKSLRVELLEDIRAILDRDRAGCIASERLLEDLNGDPERPWCTYNRGKPMTAKNLAGFLGHFGIKSRNVRPTEGHQAKGYDRADFADAFARYLSAAAVPSVPNRQKPDGARLPAGTDQRTAAVPSRPIRPTPDDCETF